MSSELKFTALPPGFGLATGALQQNPDGTWTATVTAQAAGTSVGKLESGTDIAVILDASFSMFAGFYRNAKVLDFVDAVVGFVAPYDDDGVDVLLHSLREAPFKYLGSFQSGADVGGQLGDFMEAAAAMRSMGQKTFCAPAIRDIVTRLKEEKKSSRVFVEVVTDGAFDDKDELEALIVELGNKYNTPEHPLGVRFHFTGIGPGGAKATEFLTYLDDQLEAKYPGFIDCVDYDAAGTVAENVSSIVKELKHVVRLEVDNAMVMVTGADGAEATHVCNAHEGEWQDGNVLSFEGLPTELVVHANFASRPAGVKVAVSFIDSKTDQPCEWVLDAVA